MIRFDIEKTKNGNEVLVINKLYSGSEKQTKISFANGELDQLLKFLQQSRQAAVSGGLPLYSSMAEMASEKLDKTEWFDCPNNCEVDKVIWINGDAHCSECGEEGTVYRNRQ